jgi:metal-dependent amidase/aminoacylase/carboxypeptidase family protein
MDESLNGRIMTMIESTIEGVVAHRGLEYQLELKQIMPVIYNNPDLQEKLAKIASGLLGANAVRRPQYQTGEDDCLAQFYRSIPAMVLQLGVPDVAVLLSGNSEDRWQELSPTIETGVRILSLALCQDAGSA